MQRHLLLATLFTLQTIQSAEQFSVDTNIIAATVAFGHHHFDIPTLYGMKSLSKKFEKFICSQEDNFYSIIIGKSGKETTSVQRICNVCFREQCVRYDNDNPSYCSHNSKPGRYWALAHEYRGLLYRTVSTQRYAAYLAATEINELVELSNTAKKFDTIFMVTLTLPNVSIPTIALPKKSSVNLDHGAHVHFSYNKTSRPYLIAHTHAVGILEGIPENFVTTVDDCIIPPINTIRECSISDEGIVTRRNTFFALNKEKYNFGFICLFPKLYKEYVYQIERQLCDAERTSDCVVFSSDNFYEKHLTEKNSLETFANMLKLLQEIIPEKKYYNPYGVDDCILLKKKLIVRFNSTEVQPLINQKRLLQYALCAATCGTKNMALDFLQVYNYAVKKCKYQNIASLFGKSRIKYRNYESYDKFKSAKKAHYSALLEKVKNLQLENELTIQKTNTNVLHALFHITQPTTIFSWLWSYLFTSKRT